MFDIFVQDKIISTRLTMAAVGSRIEINLCRLLARCEAMATNNKEDDWRLEKVLY